MQINTVSHEEMFKKFLQYYPQWKDEILGYSPKNQYSIRVSMTGGRYVDFNARSNTYRWGQEYVVSTPDDVTDEFCRTVFATNLVEYMNVKGFNQVNLAERTGLSTAAISKYMRGISTPSITALQKIAYALNCAPEELLH